jgi:hypothetical protein
MQTSRPSLEHLSAITTNTTMAHITKRQQRHEQKFPTPHAHFEQSWRNRHASRQLELCLSAFSMSPYTNRVTGMADDSGALGIASDMISTNFPNQINKF